MAPTCTLSHALALARRIALLVAVAVALGSAAPPGGPPGSAPCAAFSYDGSPFSSFAEVGTNCSACVAAGCAYKLGTLTCVPRGGPAGDGGGDGDDDDPSTNLEDTALVASDCPASLDCGAQPDCSACVAVNGECAWCASSALCVAAADAFSLVRRRGAVARLEGVRWRTLSLSAVVVGSCC